MTLEASLGGILAIMDLKVALRRILTRMGLKVAILMRTTSKLPKGTALGQEEEDGVLLEELGVGVLVDGQLVEEVLGAGVLGDEWDGVVLVDEVLGSGVLGDEVLVDGVLRK